MPPTRADRRRADLFWAVAAALALLIVATAVHPTDPDFDAVVPTPRRAAPAPRLVYPAGQLPSLALPNGERRAVRSLLTVERPLTYGDYVWNEAKVPTGAIWVRVDLRGQTMSVFRAGHEIGAAVILYGTDGKQTPTGVFPVLAKARHHRSSLYDAEMPYMLRLTADGVAVHASSVREGAATHGCIGIPEPFARLLFDQIRRGDQVVIG